jgi:hypothetical protein
VTARTRRIRSTLARRSCLSILAAVAASACGDAAREETPPTEAPRDTTPALAPEPPLEQSFRGLEFVVPAYRANRERGLGIVFQRTDESPPREDTALVHTHPEESAAVVARLIRSATAVYALEVRTPVAEGGALEFGYEDIGLPLMEAPTDPPAPQWLHVLYALAPDSTRLSGWVRNDTTRLSHSLWSDRLPESPLFFLDADSIAFHDSVDGPRVQMELMPDDGTQRFDYIMHALETRGAWMRAEVVSPSDYCFDPSSPRRDTVWIRYLDARSRPRVWYYTRGC